MTENGLKSQKRILTDATMTSGNLLPNSTPKKRKLDVEEPSVRLNVPPRSSAPKSFGSSQMQPKSRFEEDLEKLTQDITGLKESNAEKDQQWDRPPLGDFDPAKDNLCFQQIDVEEGESNGRTAVKLFGVTEVCSLSGTLVGVFSGSLFCRKGTPFFSMSKAFATTSILLLRSDSTPRTSNHIPLS